MPGPLAEGIFLADARTSCTGSYDGAGRLGSIGQIRLPDATYNVKEAAHTISSRIHSTTEVRFGAQPNSSRACLPRTRLLEPRP